MASVLFFDLIGSTAMTQRLEPEDVVAVLNDVFGAVVDCVTKEGGWVNKFEGDAALCVFGPPTEHIGHAAAALRAARALRTEFIALAESHPGLDAAIGVSSGEVIAGNIGAADRYEYTVIGDAVNEAAPHRAGQKGTRTFARVTRCGRRGRRRDVLVASARADAVAGPVIGDRNLRRPTRRSARWEHLPLAGERKSTL